LSTQQQQSGGDTAADVNVTMTPTGVEHVATVGECGTRTRVNVTMTPTGVEHIDELPFLNDSFCCERDHDADRR
jgi:hypothetical protein